MIKAWQMINENNYLPCFKYSELTKMEGHYQIALVRPFLQMNHH
jgi:hypothetical protein